MHGIVQRASVDHVERLQAGVVVVEPDASGAGAFQQRSQLPRPEAVREVDACLIGGVFKANHRIVRRLRCSQCLRRDILLPRKRRLPHRRWCRGHGDSTE